MQYPTDRPYWQKALEALWSGYGLLGVLIIVLVAAGLLWAFGVDVGAIVNGWLGR